MPDSINVRALAASDRSPVSRATLCLTSSIESSAAALSDSGSPDRSIESERLTSSAAKDSETLPGRRSSWSLTRADIEARARSSGAISDIALDSSSKAASVSPLIRATLAKRNFLDAVGRSSEMCPSAILTSPLSKAKSAAASLRGSESLIATACSRTTAAAALSSSAISPMLSFIQSASISPALIMW